MTMEPGLGPERPPTGAFGGEDVRRNPVTETAKQEAKSVAQHVRTQARDAGVKAKDRARSSFEQQKGRVARDAGGLANALRETAERLEANDQSNLAVYCRSAANVCERAASSIEEQDFQGFVGSVDRVAKREPLLVFAGAAALGFLASRAIRAAREGELGSLESEQDIDYAVGQAEERAY